MKQIRLKDETIVVKTCMKCPMGHRSVFGMRCGVEQNTLFSGERIPEWCPLEDVE